MKITFIDKNKALVAKVKKAVKYFPVKIDCIEGDIFKQVEAEKYWELPPKDNGVDIKIATVFIGNNKIRFEVLEEPKS